MTRIVAACAAAFVPLVLGGCDVLAILHGFPEPRVVTQGSLPIELSYREGKGGLVILSGRVNGKVDVDFVLDTGAPVTVLIDGERTAALGIDTSNARHLGPSDDPAAPIGVFRGGLTLTFGDVTLGELTAAVLPESSLACPDRFRTIGFAGAIGADLFRRFVVEVDPKSRRVRLHEPGAWKVPPGAVEVPITFDRGHPFVDTKADRPAVQQRGAVGSGLLSQRPYAVNYPGKRLILI